MEMGRRFPKDPRVMLPVLRAADVTLCGGWFSGTLVDEDGRLLAFAFMANGTDGILPTTTQKALDRIATALAACGCR